MLPPYTPAPARAFRNGWGKLCSIVPPPFLLLFREKSPLRTGFQRKVFREKSTMKNLWEKPPITLNQRGTKAGCTIWQDIKKRKKTSSWSDSNPWPLSGSIGMHCSSVLRPLPTLEWLCSVFDKQVKAIHFLSKYLDFSIAGRIGTVWRHRAWAWGTWSKKTLTQLSSARRSVTHLY